MNEELEKKIEIIETKIDTLVEYLKSVAAALQEDLKLEHQYYQKAIEFFELITKTNNLVANTSGLGEERVLCNKINECKEHDDYCPYCEKNKAQKHFVVKESFRHLGPDKLSEIIEKRKKKSTRF